MRPVERGRRAGRGEGVTPDRNGRVLPIIWLKACPKAASASACWIMVLAQQTPYILLDEPTTYLDLRYGGDPRTARADAPARALPWWWFCTISNRVNYGDSLVFLRQERLRGTA